MHINWLKNQICVLRCILRSHARNGYEFQTPGHRWLLAKHWDTWFLTLVNPKLVWNSWNLACYHGATSTCRGKSFVRFGACLGISFSQTRASHNKRDGFGTERATYGDETISTASYCFQIFCCVNIEQQECCVIFVIFQGSFGHFYALTGFLGILCA